MGKILETQEANDKKQFFLKFLFFYFIPAAISSMFFNNNPFTILFFQTIFSVIIINVCMKYIGEIKENESSLGKLTFWSLMISGIIPFAMTLVCIVLLISPKAISSKTFIKLGIYVCGALLFSSFINSCVFPIQVLLPGNKAWAVHDNSYEPIIIDESSDINESIIVAKQMLSLEESDFQSRHRDTNSTDNFFAPYSVKTFNRCEKPHGCDVIRPGDKLKLTHKYYYKHIGLSGVFNSNHYYFVAVDEVGRRLEILDFMMDDFEKPFKDDEKLFKIKKNFYNEQNELVKEVMVIQKNLNPKGEMRMDQIINDPQITKEASNKIINIISSNSYEFSNLIYESLFASDKIDSRLKKMLVNKLKSAKIYSLLDSSNLNKQILDEIFEGLIVSISLNDPMLIEKVLFAKILSEYDTEMYIKTLIGSSSSIKYDEKLLEHLIDSSKTNESALRALSDFIIESYKNLPRANNLFKQIIESKRMTKMQLIYNLQSIINSYKPLPETGAYLLAILTSSKVDNELIEKIKEVLPKIGDSILFGDKIRYILSNEKYKNN